MSVATDRAQRWCRASERRTRDDDADKEMCENKTDNINRSDGDFVELPPSFTAQIGLVGPAVYVVWLCGDQGYGGLYSPGFGCAGIVNASRDQWLQSYFDDDVDDGIAGGPFKIGGGGL